MIDPNLPIDKIAAFVVSKSNEQGPDFRRTHFITSMSPLPTKMFNGPSKDDLTGRKCGRFLVIGYSAWLPGRGSARNPGRWVVKCSCGRYQILTTKTIKENKPTTKCRECARNYQTITLNRYERIN